MSLKKGSETSYTKSSEYSYDDIGRTEWEKDYFKINGVNELIKETNYEYLSSGELFKADVDHKNVYGNPNQGLSIIDYYGYNTDGQRVLKESAETIKYHYTGSAVLFTTDINNVKKSENVVTPGGEVVSSKRFEGIDSGKWFYFNYDMRGSTTVILKPDGSYKKYYHYDTFGNTTEGGGSFYNETQFTGAIHDKSTGMHYLNARYYNPETGRFLTQDSYTGNPYDPWTQNLYAYCGNNPVNFVDPTGHSYTLDDFYSTSHNGNAVPTPPEDYDGLTKHPTANEKKHTGYREVMEPLDHTECYYMNCYLYAFDLPIDPNTGVYTTPGEYAWNKRREGQVIDGYNGETYGVTYKSKCSADQLARLVLADMKAYGIQCERLNNYDPNMTLKDNETIVAMKTSNIETPSGFYDYHFAYKTKDGLWADKQGGYPSRIGAVDATASTWDAEHKDQYYNSPTTFFKVIR